MLKRDDLRRNHGRSESHDQTKSQGEMGAPIRLVPDRVGLPTITAKSQGRVIAEALQILIEDRTIPIA